MCARWQRAFSDGGCLYSSTCVIVLILADILACEFLAHSFSCNFGAGMDHKTDFSLLICLIARLPRQRLHPAGLSQDWADKLYGKSFVSDTVQSTHEHYLQVRCAARLKLGTEDCVYVRVWGESMLLTQNAVEWCIAGAKNMRPLLYRAMTFESESARCSANCVVSHGLCIRMLCLRTRS